MASMGAAITAGTAFTPAGGMLHACQVRAPVAGLGSPVGGRSQALTGCWLPGGPRPSFQKLVAVGAAGLLGARGLQRRSQHRALHSIRRRQRAEADGGEQRAELSASFRSDLSQREGRQSSSLTDPYAYCRKMEGALKAGVRFKEMYKAAMELYKATLENLRIAEEEVAQLSAAQLAIQNAGVEMGGDQHFELSRAFEALAGSAWLGLADMQRPSAASAAASTAAGAEREQRTFASARLERERAAKASAEAALDEALREWNAAEDHIARLINELKGLRDHAADAESRALWGEVEIARLSEELYGEHDWQRYAEAKLEKLEAAHTQLQSESDMLAVEAARATECLEYSDKEVQRLRAALEQVTRERDTLSVKLNNALACFGEASALHAEESQSLEEEYASAAESAQAAQARLRELQKTSILRLAFQRVFRDDEEDD
eukprot:CAMPEP_0204107308 /NCGR_PEP_ID=MMETSP0361-20130328/54_1 /ASSEMBLY_ACC=CAM_ASM_000343 /TAXON_ID=268821 /ORGANISM="Scrippsiella Hangoei, Strain SHTV-5" /LENGTH=434 /DNA_ID=CAMNT_0051056765 /DNA_START=9 /DNA_END=1313 /DNA_ORIENTATION=+